MDNIEYKVDGAKLVITVDLSQAKLKAAQLSSTGKTRLVATSHGPVAVEYAKAKVSFSLNVMDKSML